MAPAIHGTIVCTKVTNVTGCCKVYHPKRALHHSSIVPPGVARPARLGFLPPKPARSSRHPSLLQRAKNPCADRREREIAVVCHGRQDRYVPEQSGKGDGGEGNGHDFPDAQRLRKALAVFLAFGARLPVPEWIDRACDPLAPRPIPPRPCVQAHSYPAIRTLPFVPCLWQRVLHPFSLRTITSPTSYALLPHSPFWPRCPDLGSHSPHDTQVGLVPSRTHAGLFRRPCSRPRARRACPRPRRARQGGCCAQACCAWIGYREWADR